MLTALADQLVGFFPIRYRNIARQFIKFGITGTIGAIVDFSTYNILKRGFGLEYEYIVWGQHILLANNISVFLAIVSNFILNKYWTFRDQRKDVVGQWTGYFILNLFTWALNQLLVSFLIYKVVIMEVIFGDQRDNAAKVIAIGLILFVNFLGSKFIVFKKRPAPIVG